MSLVKPPYISTEDVSRELAEEYYAICKNVYSNDLESFKRRLAQASEEVFTVANVNGLSLYDSASSAFHAASSETNGPLAIYMDLLLQRKPDFISREDAFKNYYAVFNGRPPTPMHSATINFLRRLVDTYHLPEDDETLLAEIKATAPANRYHLYYAMLRDFPKSVAQGLSEENMDCWFEFSDPIFSRYETTMIDRIDRYAESSAEPEKSKQFILKIAEAIPLVSQSRDFWRDVAKRIIEPMLTLMQVENDMPLETGGIEYSFRSKKPLDLLCATMVELWVNEGLLPSQMFERTTQLARTWHHSAIRFAPRGLEMPVTIPGNQADLPLPEAQWYALLPKPYTTGDGEYVLSSLTTQTGLDRVHKILGHCIDSYTGECMDGSIHLVSISLPDGTPVSTAELKILPGNNSTRLKYSTAPYVPVGDINLTLTQHEKKRLNNNAQLVMGGPLQAAVIEWMCAVRDEESTINTEHVGATEEYTKKSKNFWDNKNLWG